MKKTRLMALFLSMTLSMTSMGSITAIGEDGVSIGDTAASSDTALSSSEKIEDTVKEYIAKTGADIIPVEYYWEFDYSDTDENAMAEAEKYILLRTGYKKGTDDFEKEVKKKYIELTMDTPDIGYAAQEKRLLDSIGFDKEATHRHIDDRVQYMECELTVEQINKAAELEQTWNIYTPMRYIVGPKEEEPSAPVSEIPMIEGMSSSDKISRTVNDYISKTGNTTIPGYICWVYDFSDMDEDAMLEAIEYVDSQGQKLTVSRRKSQINAKYYELTMEDERYSYRVREENIMKALGIDITKADPEKNTKGRIYSDLTLEQINKAAEMDQVTLIAVPADKISPQITTSPVAAAEVTTTTTTTTMAPIVDYATKADYDKTPMKVGEYRDIRFYHPVKGDTGGLYYVGEATDNISIEKKEGGVVRVTALKEGRASFYAAAKDCAFPVRVELEIAADTAARMIDQSPDAPKINYVTSAVNTADTTTTTVTTADEKFDEEEFFVVVGTYGSDTQLRYIYPQPDGKYNAEKVVWKDAPDGLSYGDILIAEGNVSMTEVKAAPNDPVYAFAKYYIPDEGTKLRKAGSCYDLMEKKDLTVSRMTYDGSSHFSIRYNNDSYYYGLSTFGSSLGVDPTDCEQGDVFTFAFYNGNIVIPLSKNTADSAESKGDANCDGTVDMSDAVLIMQSIANPDKYKLTDQGRENADIDNDGITSGDALTIQKKLLFME